LHAERLSAKSVDFVAIVLQDSVPHPMPSCILFFAGNCSVGRFLFLVATGTLEAGL
jgi:hypothetical protein